MFYASDAPTRNGRTLTGAWIETRLVDVTIYYDGVAPSRVRGLKPLRIVLTDGPGRRTLTGAWIETFGHAVILHFRQGRTLTGAWIETSGA